MHMLLLPWPNTLADDKYKARDVHEKACTSTTDLLAQEAGSPWQVSHEPSTRMEGQPAVITTCSQPNT